MPARGVRFPRRQLEEVNSGRLIEVIARASGTSACQHERTRTSQDARRSQARHRLPGIEVSVKWRTGCEGRISYLKRGYGWDRTCLDRRKGAPIWYRHRFFAYNLVKIALAS